MLASDRKLAPFHSTSSPLRRSWKLTASSDVKCNKNESLIEAEKENFFNYFILINFMLFIKTKVLPSKIQGLGLFADEFIPKGTIISRNLLLAQQKK
ncbi:MAG: hypothetical protein ABH824_07450 [Nanoarchaeota archaeon]|nr:hypothetical protein [Nanoarchaeota archaeon]MBU1876038.1 hypothetical protein [Nanoarchaeota archaeon]